MNARLRPFATLAALSVLAAAPLAAQTYTGEGPSLFRPLAVEPTMTPATFGLATIEGMACRREPSGTFYFGICGRQTRTGPTRLSAWRRDALADGLWTRLADFDALAMDGDAQVAFAPDLLACVVFQSGGGLFVFTRASTAAAWGPRRPVSGLASQAYAPCLTWYLGQLVLITCTALAPSRVWVHDFDPSTGVATNGRAQGPALGSPNNYFQFALAIEDPAGEARAILVGERQALSSRQRWYFAAALLTAAIAYHAVFDAPFENVLDSPCQFAGGTLLMAFLGLPISQFPGSGVLRAELVCTFDASVPSSGGRVDLAVHAPVQPPNALAAVLLLGTLGGSGIQIPGVTGRLGLQPLVNLDPIPLSQRDGYNRWPLHIPPVAPGGVALQAAVFDGSPRIVLTNTANLWLR